MDKYIHFNYTDNNSENTGKLFKQAGYTHANKTNTFPIPIYKQNNNNLYGGKGGYKITCHNVVALHQLHQQTFINIFKELNTAHHTIFNLS